MLDFSPVAGNAGEIIVGRTRGDWMIPDRRVIILLAETSQVVDRATNLKERGLTRFGVLTFDRTGRGRFEGRVPVLRPGRYIAAAYCKSCQPGGLFTVGEFAVQGGSLPRTGANAKLLALVALVMLAAGTGIATRRREGN